MTSLKAADDATREAGHYWLHLNDRWTVAHWIPGFAWELLGTDETFDTDELEGRATLGDRIQPPAAIREGKR